MPQDPRHLKRIEFMQAIFAYDFCPNEQERQAWLALHPNLVSALQYLENIDTLLKKHARERPLNEINKIDLAILRTIVFEWKTAATPRKVLIDEAVELAKAYGTQNSHRFVNGVLAHIYQEEFPQEATS